MGITLESEASSNLTGQHFLHGATEFHVGQVGTPWVSALARLGKD